MANGYGEWEVPKAPRGKPPKGGLVWCRAWEDDVIHVLDPRVGKGNLGVYSEGAPVGRPEETKLNQ